jgi:hypothetical protein
MGSTNSTASSDQGLGTAGSPPNFLYPGSSVSQNPNVVNFEDGEWHHVVLSTLPPPPSSSSSSSGSSSSSRGYRLYVDGLLRAELSNRNYRRGPAVAAGDPGSSYRGSVQVSRSCPCCWLL